MPNDFHNHSVGPVAENYAQAAFDLAQDAAKTDAVLADLAGLADLLRDQPDLAALFAHPTIESDRRAATIRRLFEGKIEDLTLRLVLLLNRKHRLTEIPAIAYAFDQLNKTSRGEVDVEVASARPLTDEQRRQIADRLTAVLGQKAIVHPAVDAALIGGLKIRVGDRLIDGSVVNRLRRLSHRMSEDGHDKLRTSINRILSTEQPQLTRA
jgi:F-type H+-transporting ATPase subunit delta